MSNAGKITITGTHTAITADPHQDTQNYTTLLPRLAPTFWVRGGTASFKNRFWANARRWRLGVFRIPRIIQKMLLIVKSLSTRDPTRKIVELFLWVTGMFSRIAVLRNWAICSWLIVINNHREGKNRRRTRQWTSFVIFSFNCQ